ncbi:zinc finger protein 26-like [Diaphorina citri]|uniref:Zinc finger protein 26-like n=1 Tax=Diaphorina citri TaxID=121845 RepID=A0A1S4ENC3_DIACI|nr:zinc finger protein 26-like [Diaphorina citri]XP_026686734.1 zinc finger protein 26-like [Diaphorina citri]KAI5693142.1 hypothetical protein M8J75_009287 [Diaphorina citri]KAI5708093.1 hypothetical protein M8J77_016394 [Diaphorina citri]
MDPTTFPFYKEEYDVSELEDNVESDNEATHMVKYCDPVEVKQETRIQIEPTPKLRIHVEQFVKGKDKPKGNVSEDKYYICHQCGTVFLTRLLIIKHIKAHMREKFHCDYCKKGFRKRFSLQLHMKSHVQPPEICDICGKTFTKKLGLQKHMNIHLNLRNYQCEFCSRVFREGSALKKHLNMHNGVRYKCDICDKSYTNRPNLKLHIARHLGLDTQMTPEIKCPTCGQQFPTKHRLKVHINSQHLRIAYDCKVCSKTFHCKLNLRVHERIHKEKFACHVCGEKFNSRAGIQVHMNRHVGVSFPCPLCSKTFYLERYLTDHIIKAHN